MQEQISLHILVIEDNDALRMATVDFLRQIGHRAFGVVSGEDVDDTPVPDLPDVYLIDLNLPGEDGFSLARRIRRSHPMAGIILVTARGQLEDRLEGYRAGADNYLTKPVDQAELLACVQSLGRRLKASMARPEASMVLNRQSLILTGPDGEVALSHGETQLLAAFCRAAGQKLERWQAMQLVDPKSRGLVPANLEMRITALRRKLNQSGAPPDAIRTLRGFGYALTCQIELV